MLHFKVVTINISTIFEIQNGEDGSLFGAGGTDFALLQILAEQIRFRYVLLNREDYNYGHMDGNGEWTGMIGMLKNGEADIAIGWVANTYPRQQIVDFSFPYLIDSTAFVTAAPGLLQKEFAFLDPFQTIVWALLLMSLPISAAALSLLITCSCSSNSNKSIKVFLQVWSAELMKLLALLLNQGSYGSYKSCLVRTFMYLWSISKLILVFSYLSTLLSFLMVPLRETPLEDVQALRDAVVSGKYQLGGFKRTSQMENIMGAESGALKELADHIRHHPENVLKDFEHSVARMEAGGFATLFMRLHFMFSGSKIGLHRFYVSPDSIGYIPVCVAFRKGFPYVEKVNTIIHRIIESGIYAQNIEAIKYSLKLKAQREEPQEDKRPLSIYDIQRPAQLLLSGHILSTCCLILEICLFKFKARSSRNF